MKRFIVSVLCVAVFFIGLGGLFEKANASFKSDEKALELLKKARAAVGGETAIAGVKSMTMTGKVTKTFEIDGAARSEQGDLEINFELSGRINKQVRMGANDGSAIIDKKVDVVVVRKGDGENLPFKVESGDGTKTVVIRKKDGTTEEIKTDGVEPIILRRGDGGTVVSENINTESVDGKQVFVRKMNAPGGMDFPRSNELFRTTLSLLLSAPEGLDVSYSYVGEGSVDGAVCEIIAANDGNSTVKLYLDKSTSLPRLMTFQGQKPFIIRINKGDAAKTDAEFKTFERRAPEMAEFEVKFSDFRSVGGLQLPHKWTQTIGGKQDEVLDITGYEINPANIAEKFKQEPVKVMIRKDQ